MDVSVLTPDREIFSGKAKAVNVPGSKGQFEVLKDHAPIVSSLEKGVVRIVKDNDEIIVIDIINGFIEVIKNKVSLLVTEEIKSE